MASYFTVFTEVGPDHMGRYRDRLVPVGDRWLIAHRFVSVDWHAPDSVYRWAPTELGVVTRRPQLIRGSRGSPRMRSPIWLRLISDVPPAIDMPLCISTIMAVIAPSPSA